MPEGTVLGGSLRHFLIRTHKVLETIEIKNTVLDGVFVIPK